jgi:hypothetical protein
MTWYKMAKLETYDDRNRLNSRIRLFKKMAEQLDYLQKYVFQNAPHAKAFVENLAQSKEISSFPEIKDKLLRAANTALDNYKMFAQLCADCQDMIVKKVIEMEKQRDGFRGPNKGKNQNE